MAAELSRFSVGKITVVTRKTCRHTVMSTAKGTETKIRIVTHEEFDREPARYQNNFNNDAPNSMKHRSDYLGITMKVEYF